jgi:hypothetical protein
MTSHRLAPSAKIQIGCESEPMEISRLFKLYLDEVCATVRQRPHRSVVFEPKLRDMLRCAVYGSGSSGVKIENLDSLYKQLNGGGLKSEIEKFENDFAAAVDAATSEVYSFSTLLIFFDANNIITSRII